MNLNRRKFLAALLAVPVAAKSAPVVEEAITRYVMNLKLDIDTGSNDYSVITEWQFLPDTGYRTLTQVTLNYIHGETGQVFAWNPILGQLRDMGKQEFRG